MGRLSNTELPFYPDDKLYLAPAITFKPNEDTKITLLGEYSKSRVGGTAAFYNPAYGEVSHLYEGDKNWNDFDQEQGRIGYEIEHRLNDVVTSGRTSATTSRMRTCNIAATTPREPISPAIGVSTRSI